MEKQLKAVAEFHRAFNQIDEDIKYAANDDTSLQLSDNQVVQEEDNYADDLHQSEEIVLTEDELAHQLYGVDNDIEVSIPSVDLDEEEDEEWETLEAAGIITPCAAHDVETEKEEETIVQYTDPVGNTFELPTIKTKMPQEIMDAIMNAPEMDASEVDMSKVTWVDAPDPTTLFRNESAASFDDIVNDLSEIENVVEVVETKTELPSGFEWLLGDDIEESDEIINEGLEIPDNLKELASKIETRMQELYGCIKPYNYKETSKYCVVTINNTNEVFYI